MHGYRCLLVQLLNQEQRIWQEGENKRRRLIDDIFSLRSAVTFFLTPSYFCSICTLYMYSFIDDIFSDRRSVWMLFFYERLEMRSPSYFQILPVNIFFIKLAIATFRIFCLLKSELFDISSP